LRFLEAQGLKYTAVDIVATPPTVKELRQVLACYGGEVRKLFNSSGMRYREMGLKERLGDLSLEEALQLLTSDGMLVRRPLILFNGYGRVGFRQGQWEDLLGLSKSE
jgi:arsenate reductase